jgi:hypothetical protein
MHRVGYKSPKSRNVADPADDWVERNSKYTEDLDAFIKDNQRRIDLFIILTTSHSYNPGEQIVAYQQLHFVDNIRVNSRCLCGDFKDHHKQYRRSKTGYTYGWGRCFCCGCIKFNPTFGLGRAGRRPKEGNAKRR